MIYKAQTGKESESESDTDNEMRTIALRKVFFDEESTSLIPLILKIAAPASISAFLSQFIYIINIVFTVKIGALNEA